MVTKYRVHEVAKDFNIKSNLIVDMLKEKFGDERKHQTALEGDELDVIFETLTTQSAVENFDSYFATALSAEDFEAKKREAAERKMQKQQDEYNERKAAEQAQAASAAEQKGEQKKAEDKADSGDKAETNSAAKPSAATADTKKPQQTGKGTQAQSRKDSAGQPQKTDGKHPAQPKQGQRAENTQTAKPFSKPFQKKESTSDKNAPIQARTKGEKLTVETRQGNVTLEKYNEKYEQITPGQNIMRDQETTKQKIKQKSQQYRKQGTRSQKRETEAERLKRIALERAKKPVKIEVGDFITVGDLALKMKMTAAEVIKKLWSSLGIMANINQEIDYDTAELVATELGAKVSKEIVITIEDRIIDDRADTDEDLVTRSPVVVVMGHVDHGKTSLLDALRDASVTETEAGGITQHIGAYRVNLQGQDITFLDTPGHAAFTEMRARGAKSTDIAILVVAADDGIMPQTVEAINHAKAAEVSIVVAINKMDKPGATTDKIMQQLTEYELVPEEWGGETICVPVSAKTKMNLDKLLESVLLVAEMRELRANPNRAAKGIVIEARLDKGRGPVSTLLVQNGTLRTGDIIVAGTAVGRVRVMTDYKGLKIDEAGPSVPVEITGLAETPHAGDAFDAVSDERLARELVEQRKHQEKEDLFGEYKNVTLENLFESIAAGEIKDLNLIVKADVQGSVEAIKQNLEKLSNEEVRVKVIHGAVGAINESDVRLAQVSGAIVIGFNVRPDVAAAANAERDNVQIRMYRVIYDCIEEIEDAIKGMLAPKYRDVEIGRAEVRNVFKLSTYGTIAGSYVTDGKIARSCKIRVVRDGIVIFEDEISSLKRFKEDVKEVMSGYECGIGLNKFNDIKEQDVLEAFITEEYRDE